MNTPHHIVLSPDGGDAAPPRCQTGEDSLGNDLLLANGRWFVRIRWVVIAALVAGGLAGWREVLSLSKAEWLPLLGWSFSMTCVLTVANVLFDRFLRGIGGTAAPSRVEFLIWLQIVTDLTVLTVLIHLAGLTDTFLIFAYLFHIVLACIFFPTRKSLLVLALSLILYLGCLALESCGAIARHVLPGWPTAPTAPLVSLVNPLSAVFAWCVVWYLTSTLSRAVRKRDHALALANDRLVAADREKNLLMLRTAHDLKAPFAGIETNIEMLKRQEWAALSETTRTLVNAIESRSVTLRERIRDILLLGELRRVEGPVTPDERINLEELLATVMEELSGKAEQRRVGMTFHPLPAAVLSNRRQLQTLFANLITNAIAYSHEGGIVRIAMQCDLRGGVTVIVSDQGIGISEDALPRVFDEYYRSDEAARFNPLSTGLGLAIVKQIALNLGLKVGVTSESGKGTTVEVLIPQNRRGKPWLKS